MFKALVLTETEGRPKAEITAVDETSLPEGDVTVSVSHSTLNYKDALAITGKGPVVKTYPMIPGIDFVGKVVESDHSELSLGDTVIHNGWGLGENRWGGFAESARVSGDWLVRLPNAFTPYQAMAIGTAGYTAMLCVLKLEDDGVRPESGAVIVSGASGGVGSVAIALLAELGYEVVALTGRLEESDYLRDLGASRIIDRAEYSEKARPLARETWAAAVDCVGGTVLANILAACRYGATVSACGLAGGMALPTTVAPFILRNVTLAGVDSVYAPREMRERAWDRLAKVLDPDKLERITNTISLERVNEAASQLMAGGLRGRLVIEINP